MNIIFRSMQGLCVLLVGLILLGARTYPVGFVPDLIDPKTAMTLSDDAPVVSISERQDSDIAASVRILSLAQNAFREQQTPLPAQTTEPGVSTTGVVRGQVVNQSAGGSVPSDLPVTLVYFDERLQQTSIGTTTDANGNYQFDQVPISAEMRYIVAVNYRERTFVSEVFTGTPESGILDIPIVIYELTEDPGVIAIDHMVAQVNAIGDNLEITQVFTLRNNSDRAYSTSQTSPDGRAISAVISLPPGSVIWGFPDNADRYTVIQDQFAVADTLPVLPGEEHAVAVVYIIPYEASAIIEQPLNYTFTGAARVLVRPDSIGLQSAQLESTGEETIGENQWQVYEGNLSLEAGDALRYELSGSTQSVGTRDDGNLVSSNNLLPLLICGALAEVALVVGLYLWYRRRRRQKMAAPSANHQAIIDTLVRQIGELDAAYERGEIDVDQYRKQRGPLKGRLADMMDQTERG